LESVLLELILVLLPAVRHSSSFLGDLVGSLRGLTRLAALDLVGSLRSLTRLQILLSFFQLFVIFFLRIAFVYNVASCTAYVCRSLERHGCSCLSFVPFFVCLGVCLVVWFQTSTVFAFRRVQLFHVKRRQECSILGHDLGNLWAPQRTVGPL
jgi:hypothetical protein